MSNKMTRVMLGVAVLALLVLGIPMARSVRAEAAKYAHFQASSQRWLVLDREVYECSDDKYIKEPTEIVDILQAVGPRITMARVQAAMANGDLEELKVKMTSSKDPAEVRRQFIAEGRNRAYYSQFPNRLHLDELSQLRDAVAKLKVSDREVDDVLQELTLRCDDTLKYGKLAMDLHRELFPDGVRSR